MSSRTPRLFRASQWRALTPEMVEAAISRPSARLSLTKRGLLSAALTAALLGTTLMHPAHAVLLRGGGTMAQKIKDGIYDVTDYGAKGDTKYSIQGAATAGSNVINVAGANFTSADVGKVLSIVVAGGGNAPLVGTITTINSTSQIVLSVTAIASTSNATVYWGTDDTTAIQLAITAAFNAGGGIVWFPPGVYMVDGPFQDTLVHNGQLIIPTNTHPAPAVGIFFVGASMPQWWAPGGAGLFSTLPNNGGSVIFSPRNGSGTAPALLSAGAISNGNNYSTVSPAVENLIFRTAYQNPNPIQVLQFSTANTISLNNVGIDIDYPTQNLQATAPVSGGVALNMPGNNNAPFDTARNCTIVGYDTAVNWGENGHLDYVQALWCNTAFAALGSFHSLTATRICADECVKPLTFAGGPGPGASYLQIDLLDIEHGAGGNWFSPGFDITDAGNALHGVLKYLIITSGVGVDNGSFTKSGGTNLTTTALS